MLIHPVPSPNCNEFTINDEIVATLDTVRIVVVIEEARRDPVLTDSELTKRGIEDKYLDNVAVETKFRRLGVETKPGVRRVAVETRFSKFGVETYPGVSRVAVETKLRRLGVETKLRRLAVLTWLRRFGVEM
jgi:hypothetical protein